MEATTVGYSPTLYKTTCVFVQDIITNTYSRLSLKNQLKVKVYFKMKYNKFLLKSHLFIMTKI